LGRGAPQVLQLSELVLVSVRCPRVCMALLEVSAFVVIFLKGFDMLFGSLLLMKCKLTACF